MRKYLIPARQVVYISDTIETTSTIANAVTLATASTADNFGWLRYRDYQPTY